MFRYKLRTLLILLAVGPPMLAGTWTEPRPYFVKGVGRINDGPICQHPKVRLFTGRESFIERMSDAD
jgi:hypothetical protein